MEKNETPIMGLIGTIVMHSFSPSLPKASSRGLLIWFLGLSRV